MKKRILIISVFTIILTMVLMALSSCDLINKQPSDNGGDDVVDTAIDGYVYVDGVETEKVPKEDSYVAYVRSSSNNNSLHYDYEKRNIIEEGVVDFSVYFFKVSKLFATVEELENCEEQFSVGTLIGTKSYFADNNKGGSLYSIATEKPENGYVKTMKSGQFAVLVPFTVGEEKIVTVEMFGAKGDGETFDEVAIQKGLSYSGATTIEFESALYIQRLHIKLNGISNVIINGRGAEIQNNYEKYVVVNNDFVIDDSNDFTVKNLTLNCVEKKGKNTLYNNADHIQFRVSGCNNVILDNVSILCPDNSDYDRHVGSIWFSNSNNVTMQNCTVENLSKSKSYSAGVWVSAKVDGTVSGYKFINNHIEKASHDETFAFFIGTITDIEVVGNKIISRNEPVGYVSAHAVGFGAYEIETTVKNVKFYDNEIDVVTGRDAMMFGNVENIEIYNNSITVRNNSAKERIGEGLFRVPEPSKTTQKDVNIHDNKLSIVCNATLSNKFNIGSAFYSLGSGFTINNNEIYIEGSLNKLLTSCNGLVFTNNKITYTKNPLTSVTLDSSNTISVKG